MRRERLGKWEERCNSGTRKLTIWIHSMVQTSDERWCKKTSRLNPYHGADITTLAAAAQQQHLHLSGAVLSQALNTKYDKVQGYIRHHSTLTLPYVCMYICMYVCVSGCCVCMCGGSPARRSRGEEVPQDTPSVYVWWQPCATLTR